jgi:tRNA pseudouridine55 synthase
MATGVLLLGVGRATRLLGHLSRSDKSYDATIRLGVTTTTDDADGEVVTTADASTIDDVALAAAMADLTGDIQQVPSAVSAIKIGGVRSYTRVRAGEQVTLDARPVRVEQFAVVQRRGDELDVRVTCSTGTYVRALARDLGAALGVGAHLSALRRTRVGSFDLARAATLDELAIGLRLVSLEAAVASAFPRLDVSEEDATRIGYGQRVALELSGDEPVGVFAPDGRVVALMARRDGEPRSLVVFVPSG